MYKEPKLNEGSFTCPYCNVVAEQKWNSISIGKNEFGQIVFQSYGARLNNIGFLPAKMSISTCWNCKKYHIWINDRMLIPEIGGIPLPIADMPDYIKKIYNEARDVYPKSCKASAALLRLALQHLCKELGEEGKNINLDIGNLVKRGLPIEVQQALDIIRVTGNNAVHPGTIDFEDNKEVSLQLFKLLNFIVERMIVEPKKINEMFNWLPEKALKGIENRDNKK